ncbi:hypothetical protein Cgig2_031527 [Carnegiea gigantea]|uniref:ABC transmembrane type-1 domain-containing protein n=1 Tax=Carnegiea gigantea TaxID=171969 RepID=A0A9Q1K3I9_9CARY|nr:hypothetical protein Cgig2_031527 [Carnegiea gigantea]
MKESFWVIFCGTSGYLDGETSAIFAAMIDPNSCMNHFLVISIDVLLLLISIFITVFTSKPRPVKHIVPGLRISSAALAAALSLAYLSLGFWVLVQHLRSEKTSVPLHGWLVLLLNGITWLFLGGILSFRRPFSAKLLKTCSAVFSLYAVFISIIALLEVAVSGRVASAKVILDILCLPGPVLLLLCAFPGRTNDREPESEIQNHECYYMPLQDDEDAYITDKNTTPFAKAGFFSEMSFWWLNPLMKKGKQKILDDDDIPKLRPADSAETCYRDFMEKLRKQKEKESTSSAPILPTIFSWQKKGIIISGGFAFIKVLTLSTGPLFLKAFIDVAEGNKAFKCEGFVLTFLLFLTKSLESLSERQWCFRTRLIGLQLRSMLSAAAYQKQLRLSNEAKTTHSPGEIINYVTVDAYRIGEFPFWFHQIWTVCLQMCLALVIIYYCVGIATVAALIMIALAVLGNSPLGKLQHQYQTKLMVEQDKRLRATTEALVTMKVLKLYAWEMNFKKAIEHLRNIEFKWLTSVVLQKGGYYMILFWSFPILMSVTTFSACYFFGIPLNASNIFTFLATLRIVQDPVRLVPDVVGAYVQARVSLDRLIRFLEAPELQNQHIQERKTGEELQQSIVIRSIGISWENTSSKPTLSDVNLVIKPGEKVAICGEPKMEIRSRDSHGKA